MGPALEGDLLNHVGFAFDPARDARVERGARREGIETQGGEQFAPEFLLVCAGLSCGAWSGRAALPAGSVPGAASPRTRSPGPRGPPAASSRRRARPGYGCWPGRVAGGSHADLRRALGQGYRAQPNPAESRHSGLHGDGQPSARHANHQVRVGVGRGEHADVRPGIHRRRTRPSGSRPTHQSKRTAQRPTTDSVSTGQYPSGWLRAAARVPPGCRPVARPGRPGAGIRRLLRGRDGSLPWIDRPTTSRARLENLRAVAQPLAFPGGKRCRSGPGRTTS